MACRDRLIRSKYTLLVSEHTYIYMHTYIFNFKIPSYNWNSGKFNTFSSDNPCKQTMSENLLSVNHLTDKYYWTEVIELIY